MRVDMPEQSNPALKSPGFNPDFIIYTDGGCHNNGPRKGDGAWAFTLYSKDAKVTDVTCGIMMDTTNNRAEMMAIIQALRKCPEHSKVLIISDSGYVVKGYNHPSYLDTWMKNGWKTSSGGPVLNIDLWLEIVALSYRVGVKFKLVKGHYKDPNPEHALWNSVVDRACTNLIKNNIITEYATYRYDFATKKFSRHKLMEVLPMSNKIIDEIGGTHEDGCGWTPNGTFCGECSESTCVGCPNVSKEDK